MTEARQAAERRRERFAAEFDALAATRANVVRLPERRTTLREEHDRYARERLLHPYGEFRP